MLFFSFLDPLIDDKVPQKVSLFSFFIFLIFFFFQTELKSSFEHKPILYLKWFYLFGIPIGCPLIHILLQFYDDVFLIWFSLIFFFFFVVGEWKWASVKLINNNHRWNLSETSEDAKHKKKNKLWAKNWENDSQYHQFIWISRFSYFKLRMTVCIDSISLFVYSFQRFRPIESCRRNVPCVFFFSCSRQTMYDVSKWNGVSKRP